MKNRALLSFAFVVLIFLAFACKAPQQAGPAAPAGTADKKPAAASKAPEPKATPAAPTKTAPEAAPKPEKAEALPDAKKSQPPAPKDWTTIVNKDFGIQFKVPAHWNADSSEQDGVQMFVAASPDNDLEMYVLVNKDPNPTAKEILDAVVDSLGFHVEGEFKQVADGLIYAHGKGTDKGKQVGFYIMVYAYEHNNYVAFITTPSDHMDKNDETMIQILESFELI